MLVFDQIEPLQVYINGLQVEGQVVGFVPTMGALHKGHISLIEIANSECDMMVASVFVNPAQFNNSEDFETYPRTIKTDLEMLEAAGCQVSFIPKTSTVYPQSFKPLKIDLNGIDKPMEGAHRPGHFEGMIRVVHRLLEIVMPNRAYFGEKDFQQLSIIKKMAETLNLNTEIIGCPIIRESSGLARSSRNELLDPQDRERAAILYKLLMKSKALVENHSPNEVVSLIREDFEKEQVKIDYFEICNENDLQPTKKWDEKKPSRAFLAGYFNNVRLIDNLRLIP